MTPAMMQNEMAVSQEKAENGRALFLTSLFILVVTAFMLHIMLIYAPIQGKDLRVYFQHSVLSSPVVEALQSDMTYSSMLELRLQSFVYTCFDTVLGLRIFAILCHLFSAALVVGLLWICLKPRGRITVPLAGGLLMAVMPFSAFLIAHTAGCTLLTGMVLALAGAVLLLLATAESARRQYALVSLAAWCVATATAVHPVLVFAPIAYVMLDYLRVRKVRKPFLKIDWPVHGIVFGTGVLVVFVIYLSGKTISFDFDALRYPLFIISILLVCRFIYGVSSRVTRYLCAGIFVLLLLGGAVFSFMQTLRYADPVWQLEKKISTMEDAPIRRRLALHYYYAAQQQITEAEKQALTREALSLWPMEEGFQEAASWERLLWGRAMLDMNEAQPALLMVEPVLRETPLGHVGREAARVKASAMHETDTTVALVTLFDYVSRHTSLSEAETLHYARALFSLGDMNKAAEQFASLPELSEDSSDGRLQRQAIAAASRANTLQEDYRKQILEDPQSVSGYVALAESCLISGDLLRAFYWLEMTLKREPDAEGAWELLGTVFALNQRHTYFIEQWGNLREENPQAWFELAQRTAHNGAWDASYAYAEHAEDIRGLSSEEYMALFAVELNQLARAEEWLSRAVEAHPLSYTPRLLRADLAIAQNKLTEARRYLDEARLMQAPEAEISKRMARLRQGELDTSSAEEPFKPVRTYIQ